MTITATAPEQASPPAPAADIDPDAILRARRAPHAAVGALVVAAAAARLAADVTGDEQVVATWTAGAAFVIAVVAATRVRRRVFDKRALRRAYVFLCVAVAWLTTVAATGLTMGAVGVLMAVGYGLALHWWRLHPIGPLPEAKTAEQPIRYGALWAKNVSSKGGCLPGSKLTDEERIPAGVRFALRLLPGQQTYEGVMGALSKVRGGLELLRDQDLIIEQHPTLPEPHLMLTIVTRSPIRESVLHPGRSAFDPTTGRVRLGPFVDGEGTAAWKAYTDNRLWGGFIQGGTGAGKSRLVESVVMPLADSSTHPTVILYGDGQGGASSPLLMQHADVKARTAKQILAMLEGMRLVMLLRQDENAINGDEGFAPTEARPGLLGVIDECHKPLSKLENPLIWERIQYLMATIAREGGKVGVALVLASQMTTLDVFGGAGTTNSEAIRTNLLQGNGVMMRSKDPNAKTIFGVDINPKKFPPIPGYAFLVNPDPGARSAPFRGYYVTDRLRAEWPGQIRWRSLDPGAAAAWGLDYLRRRELEREALDAVRQRLAARRAGQYVEEPAPAAGATVETFGTLAFPSWAEMEKAARQEAERAIGPNHQRVLDAVLGGAKKPSQIAEVTGYSVRQVHNLLDDLLLATRVQKVVPPGKTLGWYEPVAAAA